MKPDEYIDAVRWLDRSESVSNLPGFFMEQNVKNACDFLLKDKSIYTYHVNFFHKNTSIGADARLDNGRCLIVIDNVSC